MLDCLYNSGVFDMREKEKFWSFLGLIIYLILIIPFSFALYITGKNKEIEEMFEGLE